MLCEKCKNKKPTVFFTDADGKNRSLCAACAAASPCAVSADGGNISCSISFLPRPSVSPCALPPPCPVIPDSESPEAHIRMPRRIRCELELADKLAELRSSLEYSIRHEEFEKAAQLRDKIKKLSCAN